MKRSLKDISIKDIALLDIAVMSLVALGNGQPVRALSDEDATRAQELVNILDEVDAEGMPDLGVTL